jgi:pimeloyl-ACP methyl ester carboxylesterase
MVKSVASSVTGQTVSKCGHFIPEERPEELLRLFTAFVQKVLND